VKKSGSRNSEQHPPVNLRQRRLLAIALTLLATGGFWFWITLRTQSLHHAGWPTGYSLFACLLFLAAYNWRKKLPFLPALGSSTMWMQLHIYVAFFSIAVFLLHIGPAVPDGLLERLLACLFAVVAGSGMYGLYLTRSIPRKLTATGYEVIYEQIPAKRRALIQQARSLILETVRSTDVLAQYYIRHLARFMECRRSLAYNLSPSLRTSKSLIADMNQLDRYLSPAQRIASRKLSSLIRRKEDLDYHRALQGRLKLWLFLHIGMTYGLLIVSALHGIMAHAFGGGLR
jgi:hypothetical protein